MPSSLSMSSFHFTQQDGSGSIIGSFFIVITKLAAIFLQSLAFPGLYPPPDLGPAQPFHHLEPPCLHVQDPYLAVYSAGVGAKCCHVSKLKHCNACLSSSVCAWARSPNPQVSHSDPGAMSLEPKWLRTPSRKYEASCFGL